MYQEDAQQEETSMPGAAAPGKYPVNDLEFGLPLRLPLAHISYTQPITCHILLGYLLHQSCKLTKVILHIAYISSLRSLSPIFMLALK